MPVFVIISSLTATVGGSALLFGMGALALEFTRRFIGERTPEEDLHKKETKERTEKIKTE